MGAACWRAIFRHFQLERDRIGMLAERNLLSTRLAGASLQDLEDFRDKYLYVLTTIPDADLPKPSTMFNHLIDELDKCPALKQKVEKARESRPGSHRRTTEWLWNGVDIALELHQQKINRQELYRTLGVSLRFSVPTRSCPKALTHPLLLLPRIPLFLQLQPHVRRRRKRRQRKRTPKSRQHLLPTKARARAREKVIHLRGEPLLVEQEEVGMETPLPALNKHVVRVR